MLRVALLSYFIDNVEAELLVILGFDDFLTFLLKHQRAVFSLLLVPLQALVVATTVQISMEQILYILCVVSDALLEEFDLETQILGHVNINEAGMLKIYVQPRKVHLDQDVAKLWLKVHTSHAEVVFIDFELLELEPDPHPRDRLCKTF